MAIGNAYRIIFTFDIYPSIAVSKQLQERILLMQTKTFFENIKYSTSTYLHLVCVCVFVTVSACLFIVQTGETSEANFKQSSGKSEFANNNN